MGKSYRYDRDEDGGGFVSRKQMRKAKKAAKIQRQENTRREGRMDGGVEEREAPFDPLQTVEPGYADSFER